MKSCPVTAQLGWPRAHLLRNRGLECTAQAVQQRKALLFDEVFSSWEMAAQPSKLSWAEMRASPCSMLITLLPWTRIPSHLHCLLLGLPKCHYEWHSPHSFLSWKELIRPRGWEAKAQALAVGLFLPQSIPSVGCPNPRSSMWTFDPPRCLFAPIGKKSSVSAFAGEMSKRSNLDYI